MIRKGQMQGVAKGDVKGQVAWLAQLFWGLPIPIIYCQEHGAVPVPEEQLPVLLPEVENWMLTGTGASPLAAIESFVHTTCPICGQAARRETDVSDNFLDSAWYFLRYLSHDDQTQPWDQDLLRKWLPVDMYIGGAEHSVLHLMYVRAPVYKQVDNTSFSPLEKYHTVWYSLKREDEHTEAYSYHGSYREA